MELSKLFPRAPSFKFTSPPARFQSLHSAHNARSGYNKRIWAACLIILTSLLLLYFFKDHHLELQQASGYGELPHSSHTLPGYGEAYQKQLGYGEAYQKRTGYGGAYQKRAGYGVVIDIGRVEARVHVLQFEETERMEIRVLGRENILAPYNVPVLLRKFLEYAKGLVPEVEQVHSRVYVLGTGSLAWVPEQNRVAFLAECRKCVRQSGFMFQDAWALVLNGRDEGVHEWVASNYALSNVGSDSTDTIGVLNLGDESAQVTFVSESVPPSAYLHKIELWGTTYSLYSYSFDKLGLETTSKSLLKLLHTRAVASSKGGSGGKVVLDPCSPPGFGGPNHLGTGVAGDTAGTSTIDKTFPTIPSGNFSACRAESLALLQQGQGVCRETNCPTGTIFVPELRGNFIATGKFYEISKYFGLPGNASLAEVVAAGESYCGGEVRDILKDPFPEYEVVRKPCFSASFIVAFLHDNLGFPFIGSKVVFTDAVKSVPVEWTVGFFVTLFEKKRNIKKKQSNGSSATALLLIFGDVLENSVALFVGGSALVGVVVWVVARRRRPQLKTIYDLEKGRYFTTTTARGR